MTKVTFITGNAHKAKYFSELVGHHIDHHPADIVEIQSLDLAKIVEHKARAAYEKLKTPVIVEDTGLFIHSLGKLPGPFIKWFIKEVGLEKICRLADISDDRSAVAGASFAYYDGEQLEIFKSGLSGTISVNPKGDNGFGWNQIFIPSGESRTLAEMDDLTFKKFYIQIKAFKQIKNFLDNIDKKLA